MLRKRWADRADLNAAACVRVVALLDDNWIRAAAANSEDLNLISSRTAAAAYVAHWHNRLAVSVRFDWREDWCRISSAEAR